MKKVIFSFAILIGMSSSFACEDLRTQYLCAKDTVVSTDGFVGEVIGVNPHTSSVAVKWHTTTSGFSTNSRTSAKIEDLSIGRGCLSYICVKDKVVSNQGFVGEVIGVNPHTSSVAVKWHTTTSGFSTNNRSTVDIRTLSIGRGCVHGICVKDTVVSANGFVGEVIGVNPFMINVAVKWHTTPSGFSTNTRSVADIHELFVEKFCEDYNTTDRRHTININFKGSIIDNSFEFRYARMH